MINVLETAPIVGNRLNDKVSTLIGPSRDLAELQRIVIAYNDLIIGESDQVQLDLFPYDGNQRAMLSGNAMGIFYIGTRMGQLEERKKYLKDLGPTLREIMIG